MLKYFTFLSLLFTAFIVNAQVTIDPDNEHIVYWGRVDFSNPKAPAFEYSGVTIRAKFTGTSLAAKLQNTGSNYFYSIVDGGTPQKIQALAGSHGYTLAKALTVGAHTVEIIKLTEASTGRMAFQGFTLDNGSSLQALTTEPKCHIEFIGNSITCGYGNELNIPAPPNGDPNTGFKPVNENNYQAWGYIAARKLGMKYNAVCYSGRGLYRNNDATTSGTLPDIYDRTFPGSASPTWSHTSQHPNYIVIDLGTNDFFPDPAKPVDQASFESTYVNFVKKLKGYHPAATIILAVGVMMSDDYPAGAQQWTRIRTYVKNAVNTLTTAGYMGVHYFEMAPQTAPYGEDWHPSIATHTRMGTDLATFITSLAIPCTPTSNLAYTIPNWLDNKKAAVSLTFDDWSAGHPAIVVPELKKRGMHATFFVSNALGAPNWSQVQTAHTDGNEIGNHTFTHGHMKELTAAQKSTEIRGAKASFSQKLGGAKVLSFAYPFGEYDQSIIDSTRNSNHIGARTVQPSSGNYTYNFAPTDNDYYKILTFGMDNTISQEAFFNQIKNVVNGGGLLTYLYHSIYSGTVADNSYAQIHQNDLGKQLDTLLSQKDQVWISTFGQAIQYHRERKTAVLTESSAPFKEGDTWKLLLTDQLPDSLYFQPLTVQVKMPAEVSNVLSIVQNDKPLAFKINLSNLVFNAVPDGGTIIINVSDCAVPVLNLHPTNTTSFCVPQKALLYADHTAGNAYEWSKDGLPIANSDNDTLLVDAFGKYAVKITKDGCSVSSEILGKTVTVTNTGNCGEPRADFKVDKTPGIKLQTLTFTDGSENVEPNATYLWKFGEEVIFMPSSNKGSEYTGKGPVLVQFQTSGIKKVILTVSGSVKEGTVTHDINVLDKAGCIINETFDDDKMVAIKGGWNNYAFSAENSALTVKVPADNTNEWYSFSLPFHTDYTPKPIAFDITKRPVIKFRAKASDTLTLKLSLIDIKNKTADGAALSAISKFDITTEYKDFELNLQGLFFNQWDTSAVKTLDSSSIVSIDFRINSGYKSYPFKNSFGQTINQSFVGTLQIDWLGVNENCTSPIVSQSDEVVARNSVNLVPNPAHEWLTLNYVGDHKPWAIMGGMGQIFLTGSDKNINVSALPTGLYSIKLADQVLRFVKY